jgi:hypothetical protein
MEERRPELLMRDERQPAPVLWNARESDAQFWSGKRGLTLLQLVGVLLLFVAIGVVFWNAIYWRLWVSKAHGSLLELLISSFGGWIIAFAFFGALFLLFRWRVHRALLAAKGRASHSEFGHIRREN